ncbi:hypothetical protein TKK_0009224 [Trichogramma kaykai]
MTLHLGVGSEQPPKVDGKIRLYSMKFCPFAHKVRLVLALKDLPHEIVNINLKNKPEWYSKIHPEGKVPALVDLNDEVVVDSSVIINYLEDKYPEPSLRNKDTLSKDLELIESFGTIVKIFSSCIHSTDKRPLQEAVDEISIHLIGFEQELKKRQTTFFKGDTPGIVDIEMWPFVERSKALAVIYNETFKFEKEKFPNLMKWIAEMKKQKFVTENSCSYEAFAKVVMNSSSSETFSYDDY